MCLIWNHYVSSTTTSWDYGRVCCILTFDPAKHAIPKRCTGRKWHIPMASNRKKSRWRIWLTKWDKVKAHDPLTDWCTGREWPLNCMTVISAWWRSNMPFQRLSGRLNYYITRWGQEVSELESDELETICGRESHHPVEEALGAPSSFGDPLVTRCGRERQHSAESWAPGPPVEHQENEKDTTLMAIRVGVNMLQSLFGLQLPLARKPCNKVRGIFFKEVFARLLLLRQYVFNIYMCICIDEYAYDYTTTVLSATYGNH